jgi:hypothetical protein
MQLAHRIEQHQRAISARQRALLRDIAEFDQTESWRGDGALSMTGWLQNRCRISAATARSYVATATKLGVLPRLADAFSEGSLTLDVLAPIASVATPESDADLASDSVHWTPWQARELASEVRGMRDADSARRHENRCLRFDDARCTLWAQLTKDKYALVKSAIVGRARLHNHPSASDPDYEPFERRAADALVEVCTERGRRDGGTLFGGAAATVVVHADLSLLEGGDGEGRASIGGLGPISAEVARRLSCDAKLMLSLDAPDGTCLDQYPLRRSPTTAQRIEVRRRDTGCRFPACGYTIITDVHHIVPVEHRGPTVLSNLITLCAAHHSRVHELGWSMRGDANENVTFTSPHGRASVSSPSPTWRRSLPMRK